MNYLFANILYSSKTTTIQTQTMEARQLLAEFNKIQKPIQDAIESNHYVDLGSVEYIDLENTTMMKIKVIPSYGFHKGQEYFITLQLRTNEWPLVFIDSVLFDTIKTIQYLKNKGRSGPHKGICIKLFSYAYKFPKYFKNICNSQWENYVFQLISFFNSFDHDFEKGNGIKSNFKELLTTSEWIDL